MLFTKSQTGVRQVSAGVRQSRHYKVHVDLVEPLAYLDRDNRSRVILENIR